jgi:hypothetical protein
MSNPKDDYCDDYNDDDEAYWEDIEAQMEFDQMVADSMDEEDEE